MFVITPILHTGDCPITRAGIRTLWAIPCEYIIGLEFDNARRVSGIVIDCPDGETWTQIDFEKDTAQLTQEKSNDSVVQTISFIEAGLRNTVRNALQDLNGACCLHVVVADNSGNYHYLGISAHDLGGGDWDWTSDDMKTGEGASNTGADRAADNSEYLEQLTCISAFYAPFCTAAPLSITGCLTCPANALQSLNGDCWQTLAGDYMTTLN